MHQKKAPSRCGRTGLGLPLIGPSHLHWRCMTAPVGVRCSSMLLPQTHRPAHDRSDYMTPTVPGPVEDTERTMGAIASSIGSFGSDSFGALVKLRGAGQTADRVPAGPLSQFVQSTNSREQMPTR